MQITDSLASMISEQVTKYAFVLRTGLIIRSSISEENLLKLTNFLPRICEELAPGSFIHQSHLYIYRITHEFIIFLLTEKDSQHIKLLINEIEVRYSLKISREYKVNTKTTLESIIKTIVFSVATEMGPELMDWITNSHSSINDKDAYKIAMKTMLNLTDELEGAKKKVLFFQPFLMYDALAISYLFQIPYRRARGGSFDSALTILVDFKHRATIYSLYEEIENIIHTYEPNIVKEFLRNYSENTSSNPGNFNGLLNPLLQSFGVVKLNLLDTNVLMEDMINAVREINES